MTPAETGATKMVARLLTMAAVIGLVVWMRQSAIVEYNGDPLEHIAELRRTARFVPWHNVPESLADECGRREMRSCTELGRAVRQLGDDIGRPELADCADHDLFAMACAEADAGGCYDLAADYRDGRCVDADPVLADRYRQRACAWGVEHACDRVDTVADYVASEDEE